MTSSPTTVGRSWGQWMTALSCTDVPAPIVIRELSPRRTPPSQIAPREHASTARRSTPAAGRGAGRSGGGGRGGRGEPDVGAGRRPHGAELHDHGHRALAPMTAIL